MKYAAHIESSGVVGMKKSEMNAVLRGAFTKAGEHWHKKFRARHFSNDAYQEYGYQRRTGAYNRRKQRHLGHNLPLVFTGVSRDLSKSRTINATKNSVAVTMPVRVFNFRRSAKSPDMRKEFTTISEREHAQLDGVMEKTIDKSLNSFGRKSTKKVS